MSDQSGSPTIPASWYQDPGDAGRLRYWDGNAWTDHVSDNGVQSVNSVKAKLSDRFEGALTVGNEGDPNKIQDQLHNTGRYRGANIGEVAFQGGGTIFTEPVLVVNPKSNLIALNNPYVLFTQDGQPIAADPHVREQAAKPALLFLPRPHHVLPPPPRYSARPPPTTPPPAS